MSKALSAMNQPADEDVVNCIFKLRHQLIPRKDAAVTAVFKRWEAGEVDVLPLLTSMQQELSALQQQLAGLEAGKLQGSQNAGMQDGLLVLRLLYRYQGKGHLPLGMRMKHPLHHRLLNVRTACQHCVVTSPEATCIQDSALVRTLTTLCYLTELHVNHCWLVAAAGGSHLLSTLGAATCQPTTVHITTKHGTCSTIVTSNSEIQLSLLEQQESIKVLQIAVTSSSNPPPECGYEEPVADVVQLKPGEHVWLEAKQTGVFGWLINEMTPMKQVEMLICNLQQTQLLGTPPLCACAAANTPTAALVMVLQECPGQGGCFQQQHMRCARALLGICR